MPLLRKMPEFTHSFMLRGPNKILLFCAPLSLWFTLVISEKSQGCHRSIHGTVQGVQILTVVLVFLVWVGTTLPPSLSSLSHMLSLAATDLDWLMPSSGGQDRGELSSSWPRLPWDQNSYCRRGFILRRRVSGWVLGSIRESKAQIQRRLLQGNPRGGETTKFPIFLVHLTLKGIFLSVPG